MSKPASWDDLKPRGVARSELSDEYAEVCAVALTSASGRRLMEFLHQKYINSVLPGTPDDRALAAHNAKRQLVRELEAKITEGIAALRNKDQPHSDHPKSKPHDAQ